MRIVEKYNALNGIAITRQQIRKRIAEAKKHEQNHIAVKLQDVLDKYPEEESFKLEIINPAVEIVPQSYLHCLDCIAAEDETNGLAKAVSPSDIYQMIADRMVEMIKTANAKDWKKNWHGKNYGSGYAIPFNFASKKRYRGVNIFLLTNFSLLENPFFLTFKQVEELGGSVKKGAKGHPVVYFTQLFKVSDNEKGLDFGTYDNKKAKDFAKENGIEKIEDIPILKYYNVFNGKDITGIDFGLENFKTGFVTREAPADEANRLPVPEAILNAFPAPKLQVKFGGDRAFYSGSKDFIQMPHLSDFDTVQDYYATLFHEYSHSTGHAKRLDRDMSGKFGSKKYAFEELVAEFGATFLSAEAGIIWHSNNNHAAYLKSWNSALTHIKEDNRFIMKAATMAQKIADYILQFDEKGDPLYFQEIKANALRLEKEAKAKAEAKKKAEAKSNVAVVAKNKKKEKEEARAASEPTVTDQIKVNKKTKQIALFGTKPIEELPAAEEVKPIEEVLRVPLNNDIPEIIKAPKSSGVTKIGTASNQQCEFFTVDGEIGKFLQQVERKPYESVVITLDGMQGAGKTTTLYHFMEAFASPGNKSLFISGEEHPTSFLSIDKANKFLSEKAKNNIDTVGEVKDVEELYRLIAMYEVIFIDSWQKLLRMVGNIRLDEDLRKKFDGKVFVIIFQQTTEGRTKGGAEVVFDGDIIIKMVKEAVFENNYAYFDKNRYTLVPIETIRYNIASAKCYDPEVGPNPAEKMETAAAENSEPILLSFNYKEN